MKTYNYKGRTLQVECKIYQLGDKKVKRYQWYKVLANSRQLVCKDYIRNLK
ncbi:hypothetical protein VP424E501_P0128 [Vibrio phage 424E50-1]|nr:hypothetical protein VP424E501_P0128 [Vibrio phage 424E50-1]